MILSLRSIAFVFAAVAALPIAGCGGDVTGTGGGGGNGTGGNGTTTNSNTTNSNTTTGGGNTCADYCVSQLGCLTPTDCVLVDPNAAKTVCETSCEAGLATLTAMEKTVLDGCLDCLFAAGTPDTCFDDLPFAKCPQCDSPSVESAGEKWLDASKPPPNSAGGLCTNGKDILAGEECSASSDGTTCTLECCNGTCGVVPNVGASCTPDFGPATCTCTAGKNVGKVYQTTDACGGDVWNQCNL